MPVFGSTNGQYHMVRSVRVRTLFVRVVVLCAVVEAVEGVEPAVGGRVVPVAETQVPPADNMLIQYSI